MGQNGGQQNLCRLAAAPDDIWQEQYSGLLGNAEAAAEIIPKRDAQFGAGLGEPEEGIATVSPDITAVPPLTLRLVTWLRMSRSEPLVCSGISG